MEGSGVRPLQHAPKRLHPIGVSLTSNVLSNRVPDRFVIGEDVVGESVVGVDLGVGSFGMLHDEAAQGFALGVGDNCGLDLVGCPVLDASHGHLSRRATARKSLAFFSAHVPTLSSDIGFVNFDRASERRGAVRTRPGFTDAVQHEPSSRLPYSDIPSQLHARHALEAGNFQVDGYNPLAEIDVAMGERRSSSDTEVFAAVAAPIRHGLSVRNVMGVDATAVSATPIAAPEGALEPLCSRILIGKHIQQLHNCDAFTMGFTVCSRSLCCVLHHGNSVQESIGVVKHYG